MPEQIKPRPLITVRNLRAHFAEVVGSGEPRIVGSRWCVKCLIIPVPPKEWTKLKGPDKTLWETRKRFEELMFWLER